MPSAYPKVDLITVNYNGLSFLEDFFRSLNNLDYPMDKLRVFFVDNDSRDGSLDFFRQVKTNFECTFIANRKNLGFARANNEVFSRCTADYIALLNNDTRVDRKWLAAMVEVMLSSGDIGMVCSRRIPTEAPRLIDPVTNETSWCSGGHCLIRASALKKTGYFDEHFFMYGEDVDLSWRMWLAGYHCVYVPESLCEHHFGKEEKHLLKRQYYHVRNSILLRYLYGSSSDVTRYCKHWFKEGIHRMIIKRKPSEGCVILAALAGHIPAIPHFLKRGGFLVKKNNFRTIKDKWIQL